jgi:hypothetical protein
MINLFLLTSEEAVLLPSTYTFRHVSLNVTICPTIYVCGSTSWTPRSTTLSAVVGTGYSIAVTHNTLKGILVGLQPVPSPSLFRCLLRRLRITERGHVRHHTAADLGFWKSPNRHQQIPAKLASISRQHVLDTTTMQSSRYLPCTKYPIRVLGVLRRQEIRREVVESGAERFRRSRWLDHCSVERPGCDRTDDLDYPRRDDRESGQHGPLVRGISGKYLVLRGSVFLLDSEVVGDEGIDEEAEVAWISEAVMTIGYDNLDHETISPSCEMPRGQITQHCDMYANG